MSRRLCFWSGITFAFAGVGFAVACYISVITAQLYDGLPEMARSFWRVAALYGLASAANFVGAALYLLQAKREAGE